jgi:hypothetical protein
MAMHELPSAVLGPEEAGDAESDRGEVVATTDFCPEALYFYDASEIIRDVSCDWLEADDLTLTVARGGSGGCLSNLLPTASERAERIAERHVLSTGIQHLEGLGVPSHNLAQGETALLDRTVKVIRRHQFLQKLACPRRCSKRAAAAYLGGLGWDPNSGRHACSAYPRLDFKEGFTALIVDHAERKPGCWAARAMQPGIGEPIAAAPF